MDDIAFHAQLLNETLCMVIVGGKQLLTRRLNLCRKDKSSSKNLLEQPWVVQMFININVVDNFEHLAPMYNGHHASFR
jgi:hypothetical protein